MAAKTVSSKIRAAHRGRLFLVAMESSIVGLSAGITAFAAAATVRVDPGDPQTKVILGIVGILGAFSWWLERSGDAASVARSIDRRSGLEGALTTAFETDSSGDRSPVVAALAKRIAPLVSLRRFFRHEARSSAAVLAAPFLAIALLAAVTDGNRPSPEHPPTRSNRAGDLRGRVRDLASLPGLPAQDIAALRELAERAEQLDSRSVDPASRESAAARLEGELEDLARRIEAARGSASDAGVASRAGEGTMASPTPSVDRTRDGSMRDSPAPNPTPRPDGSAAPGSGAEGGVGASRWWPERYDGVVERWIEARRASR